MEPGRKRAVSFKIERHSLWPRLPALTISEFFTLLCYQHFAFISLYSINFCLKCFRFMWVPLSSRKCFTCSSVCTHNKEKNRYWVIWTEQKYSCVCVCLHVNVSRPFFHDRPATSNIPAVPVSQAELPVNSWQARCTCGWTLGSVSSSSSTILWVGGPPHSQPPECVRARGRSKGEVGRQPLL